jgi:hypothetical protein
VPGKRNPSRLASGKPRNRREWFIFACGCIVLALLVARMFAG